MTTTRAWTATCVPCKYTEAATGPSDALVRKARQNEECPNHPPTVHVLNADGTESDMVLRTASGKVLTEQDIEHLADDAERGYEIPS